MGKQGIIISHFLEGKSQWDIHRDTGFDRKTIRKYINQYEEKRKTLMDSGRDNLILTEEIVALPRY
jgi:transposase